MREEQHPCGANKQKQNEHDVRSLLLLAATVGSGARHNFHKNNVQYVRLIAKTTECCCNFSVGVALKVWFSHAHCPVHENDQI